MEKAGLAPKLISRLEVAAGRWTRYERDQTPLARGTREARLKIVEVAETAEPATIAKAAEDALAFHQAIYGLGEMAGMYGGNSELSTGQYYLDLSVDPRFYDAFVALGKVRGVRFDIHPWDANRSALVRLEPYVRSLPAEKASQLLRSFGTAFVERSEQQTAAMPKWDDSDTDLILKPFLSP